MVKDPYLKETSNSFF